MKDDIIIVKADTDLKLKLKMASNNINDGEVKGNMSALIRKVMSNWLKRNKKLWKELGKYDES